MSRKRLIFSLGLTSCCLASVVALAAWTFPLKAQAAARDISGVGAGISGGVSTGAAQTEPSVDVSTIWTDTAKKGAMPLQVRGAGTLVRGEGSGNLAARVTVPASMAAGLKSGQNATVASKSGALGKGHVNSVGPVSNDSRTVEIALDAVPQGTTAGLAVNASIDIGTLDNVLYVGRPTSGKQNSEISLFKIVNNGSEAVRTDVKLGRISATTAEVLSGLNEGDKVILSDTTKVQGAERIRLISDKQPSSH